MKKKILFLDTKKLAGLSAVLLLAVFCTIGMSFTPVEGEGASDPNDSTYVSGPRRSHWETGGMCSENKDEKDYAKTSVVTMGHGRVSITNTTNNGSLNSVHTETSTNEVNSEAAISWNCNSLTNGHTNSFEIVATPEDENYYFAGWSSVDDKNDMTYTNATQSITVTIPNGERGSEQVEDWEDQNHPYPTTYYAFFNELTFVDVTFLPTPEGCSYQITIEESTETVSFGEVNKTHISKVTLSNASASDDYVFVCWYQKDSEGNVITLSSESSREVFFSENVSIGAHFVLKTNPQFIIKETSTTYYGLKAATSAATYGQTIIPTADAVIDGSDLINEKDSYTIPAGVSLLIPKNATYNVRTSPQYIENSSLSPSSYRTLTLKEGANIIVNGTICVDGYAASNDGVNKTGYPTDDCGMIDMSKGGHIELNDGAILYCWGIIKGQDMIDGNNTQGVGTITANNGAVVWENFWIGDWRGGSASKEMASDYSDRMLFLFQSYTVQNIEVPVTYYYGSSLQNYTLVRAPTLSENAPISFPLIAKENALFKLKDANSVVVKWYDPTTDLVDYEMRGTAVLDALKIRISAMSISIDADSKDFNLPITSNMHVILADCNMTLNCPITVQPGAVLEVKHNAKVTIESNIYLYDSKDWGTYTGDGYYFRTFDNKTIHKYRGDGKSKDVLDDARLIVDGELYVKGNIYSSNGGASIEGVDKGIIAFQAANLPNPTTIWNYQGSNNVNWLQVPVIAANLHNGDGSYTRSIANATFHNVHGRWFVDGKQNEKADHTYDFTYMAGENIGEEDENRNTGEDVNTLAVYSKDKTGLEERMKWANVAQDDPCTDNYLAAGDIIYNYTKNNDWTQFIPDERPYGYSGSDNKLYTLDGCSFTDPVAIDDETCLYPFPDGTKALVNGVFIALTPNAYDAAYKDADNKYYICFKGCNWHEATPYEGEQKTYNVVEGGTYIWYNSDWLNVDHDGSFFYTTNDQNVKIYYEYVDGEWQIATPIIRVSTASTSKDLYTLPHAFAYASQLKEAATMTVLKDFTKTSEPCVYSAANTTCVFDLNGHVITENITGSGTVATKMITINAENSTFTIADNSGFDKGELRLIATISTATASQRWTGIYVQNGTLIIESGKVYVENHFTHTSTSNTGIVSGVQIAAGSGRNFTMNGGTLEVSGRYSVCGVHALEGRDAVITINGGTIDAKTITSTTAYGILAYGTTNIYGGTIKAKSKTTTAYGLYVNSSTSYAGTMNLRGGKVEAETESTTCYGVFVNASAANGKVGAFNMYGGEVNAKATGTAIGVYVNRALKYNSGEPRTIKTQYPAIANITGGEIKATTTSSSTAEGVRTYGTANISGGEFTIRPYTTTAFGVRLFAGTTTISDAAYFDVQATENAYGVRISEETPDSYGGAVYNGTLVMNGGFFKVKSTSATKAAYGIFVGTGSRNQTTANSSNKSYFKGNYANAGTATINNGVIIDVTAQSTNAYALFVRDVKTESRVEDKDPATATPKCTINGGKFKVTSTNDSGSIFAANDAAQAANFKIQGGYFNKTTLNNSGNLSKYIVSPKTAIALTNAEGNCPDENYPEYTHKVTEAYLITFMNGETPLQSTMQNAGSAAVYNGLEPRKDDDENNSYEFDGWATTADAESADADLSNVSAAVTYYAHFATTVKKFIITWNANTGVCATELTRVDATGSATVGTLPEASKTGHDFDGWFTAAEGGDEVSAESVVTGHVTYYAHYTVHSHQLTWNANEGEIAGTYTSGSVNYGAAITAPANANVTRTGYTFAGWNATPATTMPDNDLEYTAQWTADTTTAYSVIHKKQNPDNLEEYTTEIEEKEGTTASYVTPATKSYPGWKTPTTQTKQIAADGLMEVEYIYDCITYDIAFDATTNGGSCSADPITNIVYGHTIGSRITSLPEEPEVSKEGNDFVGWFTKAVGGDRVTTETVICYNIGTIYAQFRAKPLVEVGEDGDETVGISNNSTVDNVIVYTQGKLNVSDGRTLTATNLILEASADASGEITGNVVADNAYFDLQLNTESRHWHAFTVPFECNVSQHLILADGVEMPLGVQYDIVYYDGAERAANGKTSNCWRYVEDDADWTLVPGRAYMIVFGRNVNTVRFTKKDGVSIAYAGTPSVAKNTSTTGNNADGGWNGVGNPTTYHALLDAGVTECQVHDGGPINGDGYNLYDLTGKLVVGKAVYVQVASPKSVDVVHAEITDPNIAAKAPRRNREEMNNERYDVQIAPADGEMADRMFLLVDEEKADEYVILADLAKAGVSNRRAQMWVAKYNEKLCKHTAIPEHGTAEYPLGIFVPDDGEYDIYIAAQPDNDETLYLTYDGQAIWDLTMGAYRTAFGRGTTNHYGLRLVNKAPSVATGIEETTIENGETIRKVMIDNQVYIIRNGEVYTLTGQKVQ